MNAHLQVRTPRVKLPNGSVRLVEPGFCSGSGARSRRDGSGRPDVPSKARSDLGRTAAASSLQSSVGFGRGAGGLSDWDLPATSGGIRRLEVSGKAVAIHLSYLVTMPISPSSSGLRSQERCLKPLGRASTRCDVGEWFGLAWGKASLFPSSAGYSSSQHDGVSSARTRGGSRNPRISRHSPAFDR